MLKIKNLELLCLQYPDLVCKYSADGELLSIEGSFLLNRVYGDTVYCKEYSITINVYDNRLPYAKETGNKISEKYPHRYPDGGLCLGVDAEIELTCLENGLFDIEKWFERFVVPYFFSYEYYMDKHQYPFGDRSHGKKGVAEFYMELFNVDSVAKVYKCMRYTLAHKYRGHFLCPCGSKKRIRYCHKTQLYNAQRPEVKSRINKDYLSIKEVCSYEHNI